MQPWTNRVGNLSVDHTSIPCSLDHSSIAEMMLKVHVEVSRVSPSCTYVSVSRVFFFSFRQILWYTCDRLNATVMTRLLWTISWKFRQGPCFFFYALVCVSERKPSYYDSACVAVINGCPSCAHVLPPFWPQCCRSIQADGGREYGVMSCSNVHGGFTSEMSKHASFSRELPLGVFKIGSCKDEEGILWSWGMEWTLAAPGVMQICVIFFYEHKEWWKHIWNVTTLTSLLWHRQFSSDIFTNHSLLELI